MNQRFYEFQERHKTITVIFSYVGITIKSYIFVFILTTYIMKPICVQGSSMYPTLQDGNIGITTIFTKEITGIKRFDVVTVKAVQNNEQWIKRVIALPNETIAYKNDILYINEEIVVESYLDQAYIQTKKKQYNISNFTEDFGPIKLGENEYFLMGDNRHVSKDSRTIGTFHQKQIISKDTFILFH